MLYRAILVLYYLILSFAKLYRGVLTLYLPSLYIVPYQFFPYTGSYLIVKKLGIKTTKHDIIFGLVEWLLKMQ